MPHNIVTVDLLPAYPMTLAVVAKDNFDPDTGMEYANTKIGDGGFILYFSDGTVTDATWKALPISRGPLNGDTQNPRVESVDPPEGWTQPDFDDTDWPTATVFSEEAVRPQPTFYDLRLSAAPSSSGRPTWPWTTSSSSAKRSRRPPTGSSGPTSRT